MAEMGTERLGVCWIRHTRRRGSHRLERAVTATHVILQRDFWDWVLFWLSAIAAVWSNPCLLDMVGSATEDP